MILYRYIVREHVLPFVYSFSILTFIFVMQLAVKLLRRILFKDLGLGVVVEIFLVNMAWMVVLAVPMAVLVATLMTFGRMSADNEILAVKASGQNLFYLITPVFLAGCLLTVTLIFFHNLILPDANHRSSSLMSDISRKKPAALIEPDLLIKDFKNYAMVVGKVTHKTGKLENIRVFSDVPGEDPATTVADSGEIRFTPDERYLQLTLCSGETHSISRRNPDEYFVARFGRQILFIDNVDSELRRTERTYRGDREKSVPDLLKDVDSFREMKRTFLDNHNADLDSLMALTATLDTLTVSDSTARELGIDTITHFATWRKALRSNEASASMAVKRHQRVADRIAQQVTRQNKKISQYMVEVHKKFSTSFACIVFILIGAPLGIMAKRGGIAVGVSYSIFFFILYWTFLIGGESLADRLLVNPALAMWSCNLVVGIFGLFLIVRMVRETTFINFGPLLHSWHRITHRLSRSRVPTGVSRSYRALTRLPSSVLSKTTGILPAYLIGSFLANLVMVFASLLITFIVIDYISNLRRFESVDYRDIICYYWYYTPWFVGLVFPIGILLASMFSMGSLAKHSELTAMKASGISVHRLTLPMLALGLLLSGASFILSEKVLPEANAKRNQLTEEMQVQRAAGGGRSHHWSSNFYRNFYYFGDRSTIYCFEEFRTKPQQTRNVSRETFRGNSISERVQAAQHVYRDGKWFFVNGAVRTFGKGTCTLAPFDTLADTVLRASPDEVVTRIKSIEEMSYWELSGAIDRIRKRGEKVSRYLADLHFKIALPFMNLIVIIFGLSITARSGRRGSAVHFGVGLLLSFSYWITSQLVLALGKNEALHPMVAAWAGNAVFLVVGLYLYRRAAQ